VRCAAAVESVGSPLRATLSKQQQTAADRLAAMADRQHRRYACLTETRQHRCHCAAVPVSAEVR